MKQHICPGCGAAIDCETEQANFPPQPVADPPEPPLEPASPPVAPPTSVRRSMFRKS